MVVEGEGALSKIRKTSRIYFLYVSELTAKNKD